MDSRDDTIEVTGTGEGSGTPDLVVVTCGSTPSRSRSPLPSTPSAGC